MQSSQRGSVLLAVIAGIVLLSVLGMAMVSLMTDSVMTGVDGKETVQASYLAESGKEIVRARTAKLDGGALMEQAQELGSADKGLAVSTAGSVKLSLFPSWFRWYNNSLNTTQSGWYGKSPADSEHLWLAVSQSGTKVYKGKLSGSALDFDTTAADVYLVGRIKTLGLSSDGTTLTVTPADNTDDFAFFPESGGLIGLIPQQTGETFPISTTVDTVRFTYDRKTVSGSTYTFTNLTKLSDGVVSFEEKDLALGQYFRVVSEGTTTNGARAAQVWHTNGRNSLRFPGMGTGGANISVDAAGLLSQKDQTALHKEMQGLFGNNITGVSSASANSSSYKTSDNGLTPQTLQASTPNHFLLPTNKKTTDFWFAAASKNKTMFTGDNGGAVQISIFPKNTNALFAGTLFRLTTIKKDSPSDDSNGNSLGKGVAGLGMGIVYGKLGFNLLNFIGKIEQSSINPALLPGFTWNSIPNYFSKKGSGSKDNFESYVEMKLYQYSTDLDGFWTYEINPMIILWAYDDSQTNPPGSLRWLAVSRLPGGIPTGSFSRLVVQVQEKDGINEIRGWIEKNAQPSAGLVWPNMDLTNKEGSGNFSILKWDAVNSSYASLKSESAYGTSDNFTVQTPFATGAGKYERTGFFEGVYSANGSAPSTNNRPSFRNFAAGTLTNAGDSGDTSGLTPGLIQ